VYRDKVKTHNKGKIMKKTLFAVLAGFLAMGAAQAQTTTGAPYADTAPHAYIGFGIGAVHDSITDDRKRTKSIFGGYEFDRNWAVEAGYTDLGKTGLYAPMIPGNPYLHLKSESFYAAAKYTYPFTERSSVYGKLGLSHTRTKYSSDAIDISNKDIENGVLAAVGVQARLTEKVSLYGEYAHNGKRTRNGPDNKVLSAGVKFDF
jgi:OOP family OmpA-OmpF porin